MNNSLGTERDKMATLQKERIILKQKNNPATHLSRPGIVRSLCVKKELF